MRRVAVALVLLCAAGLALAAFDWAQHDRNAALMALFGLFGYVCAKLNCEAAPMLLGFIIGPMMEEYLRRALILSRSDPMVFVQRPISAAMLALAALALFLVLSPALQKKREEAFHEE